MNFQTIPSPIFQPANSPLMLGDDLLAYPDIDDPSGVGNKYLQQMYQSLGFKSYYGFSFRNSKGTLTGKLTMVGLVRKVAYSNEQIKEIQRHVSKIEALLNYNSKK